MRDLKHLIYFENLLQQANNDLVQAACGDGRLALAWNCSYIPEVLLDTDKCFGVRLRAPNCTNPDMATYYRPTARVHTPRASSSARSRAATTLSPRSSGRSAARR